MCVSVVLLGVSVCVLLGSVRSPSSFFTLLALKCVRLLSVFAAARTHEQQQCAGGMFKVLLAAVTAAAV